MLVSTFNLKDIKNYEISNRCSLLEMFNELNLNYLLEIIKLGNQNISDEEAGELLDNFLSENSLVDAYNEIRDILVGKKYIHNDKSESAETKNYKSLTELYQSMGIDLRAYGNLGYSEFWDMSVDDLFLEFNIANNKIAKEKQSEIDNNHMLAMMISQGIWGKLSTNPPQINKNMDDIDDDESDMDSNALRSLCNMKAFVKSYNGGANNG